MVVPLDVTGLNKVRARGGSFYYEDSNGDMKAKECRVCKEVIPVEDFRNDKRGLGGKVATCSPCKNKASREYKRANPEKIKEQHRRYLEENRDEIARRRKERISKDVDGYREYYREYYKRNRDRVLGHKRNWREENREHQNRLVKEWEMRNPEKVILQGQRRRARKAFLPDDFSLEDMERTLDYFENGCALTGDMDDLHWDHVIPISVGNVGTVMGNMIPLRADLNRRKSNLNIFDWFQRNKIQLNLCEDRFNKLIDFLAEENGMSVEEYRSFCFEQFKNKEEVV